MNKNLLGAKVELDKRDIKNAIYLAFAIQYPNRSNAGQIRTDEDYRADLLASRLVEIAYCKYLGLLDEYYARAKDQIYLYKFTDKRGDGGHDIPLLGFDCKSCRYSKEYEDRIRWTWIANDNGKYQELKPDQFYFKGYIWNEDFDWEHPEKVKNVTVTLLGFAQGKEFTLQRDHFDKMNYQLPLEKLTRLNNLILVKPGSTVKIDIVWDGFNQPKEKENIDGTEN